ncbi:hypothetical protein B0H17DRAFT_1130322 [Mycena rosella]|uniref:Uncharacterized protein n=1 Tax=Mycena rosella TaxID=1033263 RepID=A0AAD7GJC6_MYCRO|nr:hypothetical protein B0H17DRAFT_1130322 [Mycena rosella]
MSHLGLNFGQNPTPVSNGPVVNAVAGLTPVGNPAGNPSAQAQGVPPTGGNTASSTATPQGSGGNPAVPQGQNPQPGGSPATNPGPSPNPTPQIRVHGPAAPTLAEAQTEIARLSALVVNLQNKTSTETMFADPDSIACAKALANAEPKKPLPALEPGFQASALDVERYLGFDRDQLPQNANNMSYVFCSSQLSRRNRVNFRVNARRQRVNAHFNVLSPSNAAIRQ